MTVCEVCGNEIEGIGVTICPYCGSRNSHTEESGKGRFVHKKINLEAGRPIAEVAINRMTAFLADAGNNGVTLVTLIHGYGSSGKGGVIKTECRKYLDYMKAQGTIQSFIPGEEFNRKNGLVKVLLRKYPQLQSDQNLNRANRGVTLVLL